MNLVNTTNADKARACTLNKMKLTPETDILFRVNPRLTATEVMYHGGFKYHSDDTMFRNATHEMDTDYLRWYTIATYKIEGYKIESQLAEFRKECEEMGYIPANLWHLCLLSHHFPQMHRRIIVAPGTIVECDGMKWMPTIDGLNKHVPCISQIKTELRATSIDNEEFAHTSYKNRELLAVKEAF